MHGGFALIFGLPEAPTFGFGVVLLIVIGYLLLRAYSSTQGKEIDGLRTALDKQSEKHQKDMDALDTKLDRLEALYDEERGLKHQAFNDVTRTVTALHLVQELSVLCECEAQPLAPLSKIIEKIMRELETVPRRRRDDDHGSTTTTTTTTTGGST